LTTCEGVYRVDGTERLRERPIGALVDCLRGLGASIDYLDREGYAPLLIEGRTLVGGRTSLDATESSQYLSAVLMAGSRAAGAIEIDVVGLTSAPYVDVTLEALRVFGLAGGSSIEVPASGIGPGRFKVYPQTLASSPLHHLRVEGDYSAAAYPAAAAALTGGRVDLLGLVRESSQGDRRLLELLEQMEVSLEWRPGRQDRESQDPGQVLVVRGTTHLRALGTVDMGDIPDQVPTVAALSVFAAGRTEIVGVPHLRIKESDRLHAMASQLTRIGASIEERHDDLVIDGGLDWCDVKRFATAPEVEVDSFNDHRIAMSMALAGLRRPGVVVLQPEVVAKSYPRFWLDLESLIHAQPNYRTHPRSRQDESGSSCE
jgi:3-phosphoshikimate 1-carboxyvinyltransferase